MKSSIRQIIKGTNQEGGCNRLCIFVGFDATAHVAPYVEAYLKALHGEGFDIIFVQSSDQAPSADAYKVILPYCRQIVNRENIGYDFLSWKVGLDSVPDLSRYQKLLLTNDSIVGPFAPLKPILADMDRDPQALWSMTDCSETGTRHAQSYFLYLDRIVFTKSFFKRFWDSVRVLNYKWQIVVQYEVGFSVAATAAGVPLRAAFPYEKIKELCLAKGEDFQFWAEMRKEPLNPTLYSWDVLLGELGFPFMKTELLRSNRLNLRGLSRWTSVVSSAPKEIVDAALEFEDARRWAIPDRHQAGLSSTWPLGALRRSNPEVYAVLQRRYSQLKSLLRDFRSGNISEVTRKLRKLKGLGRIVERFTTSRLSQPADLSRELYFSSAQKELKEFLAGEGSIEFPACKMPQVTIVLILFNKAELTFRCLKSLEALKAESSFHVLIVDNASSDQTSALLARTNGATIVNNKNNVGFLKACNQAAELVSTEHILFLNNDTILHPGSIAAATEVLRDKAVGAVGGRIVLPNDSLQEAGSIFWNDGTCVGFGRGRPKDADESMHRRDVDYCSGVFLMTPTHLFRELGGFDELYAPAYYEEADYCAQLQSRGFRIVYDPRIVVTHVEFGSSEKSAAAFDLMNMNRGKFLNKNRALLETKYPPQTKHHLACTLRSGKSRWLFLDDRVALPQFGAGYPRMNRVIHSLVNQGKYDITIACTENFIGDWDLIRKDIPLDIEVLDLTAPQRREDFVRERLGEFDVVWISRPSNMENVVKILSPESLTARTYTLIYDSEAIFADRAVAEARTFGLPQDLAEVAMKTELNRGAVADIVVSVCEADAKRWRSVTHSPVHVIGLDAPVAPGPSNFGERRDILFPGSLHSVLSPNTDSLFWFMGQVMPFIRETLPDVTVRAVGFVEKSLREHIGSYSRNFELIGSVPDLQPYFLQHRIVVVPTRFAAGIPQKVFDAAVVGTPTVCSPLIASQMGWTDGVETLVGSTEDPADFAKKCVDLYLDEEKWLGVHRQSLEASRHYASRHTIEGGLARVVAEVERKRDMQAQLSPSKVAKL